jgi:hypothetical protein
MTALLITVGALVIVLLVPPSPANLDVAIGDVFAGGIFLLAVVAAVVAVFSYAQSSRQPMLSTE